MAQGMWQLGNPHKSIYFLLTKSKLRQGQERDKVKGEGCQQLFKGGFERACRVQVRVYVLLVRWWLSAASIRLCSEACRTNTIHKWVTLTTRRTVICLLVADFDSSSESESDWGSDVLKTPEEGDEFNKPISVGSVLNSEAALHACMFSLRPKCVWLNFLSRWLLAVLISSS